jgi:ATP-dependent helicase HrpB
VVGLPVLQVARISQASAKQRAGRAGRTGPGAPSASIPLEDFVRRPAHDTPEIARADLAPVALLLDAMGVDGLESLEWLDAPPAAGVEHAEESAAPVRRERPVGAKRWRAIRCIRGCRA